MHFFVEHYAVCNPSSLIGYSMGGNLVLKLAGDLGAAAPPQLHSVIGVSPALDLGPRPTRCICRRTASTR